ncbi:MAG: HD-GYP domain-containing protein, partial [Lachnospiraceae bacterium]|nr:HD-GYP domain-containing protein [Lachnospiraceae bacterium]
MIGFLAEHQLNFMLFLAGVCGITAVFAAISNSITPKRKVTLVAMEVVSMVLLLADRFAYIYRGDVSDIGYIMVRISNFLVFMMIIVNAAAFNQYLVDLFMNDVGLEKEPIRLHIVDIMAGTGVFLLIVSQFTGFYYTFDETNHYVRADGFVICFLLPFLMLILQLTVVLQYYGRMTRYVRLPMLLFIIVPIAASIIQFFNYGVSLSNMSEVGMAVILYIFALIDRNKALEKSNEMERQYLKKEQASMQRLFEETATAFVNAIDAKDPYTKGHSLRVAKYSKRIAEFLGKNENECNEIYYSALLHDVGKLGVPDAILNKSDKLTDEEYETVKQHPVLGEQILSNIEEFPYISTAAHYHHERYDGKGYPEKLSGEDIPEMGRIVAVADTYDTMTSTRKYRGRLPQQKVREEFIREAGRQFDPKFAEAMVHLIDLDQDYEMKEHEVNDDADESSLDFNEYRETVSRGTPIDSRILTIELESTPYEGADEKISIPTIILFDSLDGRVHSDEVNIGYMNYHEYAEIWFDGHTINTDCRMIKTYKQPARGDIEDINEGRTSRYEIEASKYKDHILIRIFGSEKTLEFTVALPDSSRFAYLAITGEHCHADNIKISRAEEIIEESYIPRIVDEISYIDRMEGDIPNLQLDGYRTHASDGIKLKTDMQLIFHTMSLPAAERVWHCPYILLYYSSDGKVSGDDYKEYVAVRINGEKEDSKEQAANE